MAVTLPFILTLFAVAAITGLAALLLGRAPARRRRAMREVLDSADALEARLRAARAEIEAVVGDEIEDPVRDAMREMLRQRLWLRDHGKAASVEQLTEVRVMIDAARVRIEQQLVQIERARAPLVR
jgi:Flp pilus assembly protein TadB